MDVCKLRLGLLTLPNRSLANVLVGAASERVGSCSGVGSPYIFWRKGSEKSVRKIKYINESRGK